MTSNAARVDGEHVNSHRTSAEILDIAAVVILGLVATGILVGLLQSTAEIESKALKATGGLAGFVAIIVICFRQLNVMSRRRESVADAMRPLQEQLDKSLAREAELRTKLLKGAAPQDHFYIEVAERDLLVLARPDEWTPRGGNVFHFQEPFEKRRLQGHYAKAGEDLVPATFRVTTTPLENGVEVADIYQRRRREFGAQLAENIRIGGEGLNGIPSLRMSAFIFVELLRDEDDMYAGDYRSISYHDYYRELHQRVAEMLKDLYGPPPPSTDDARRRNQLQAALVEQLHRGYSMGDLRATDRYVLEELADGTLTLRSQEIGLEHGEGLEAVQGVANLSGPRPAAALGAPPSLTRPFNWVSPISALVVVCAHEKLGKVFEFEFLDDPADYLHNTEKFDQILKSVRFLT